MPRCRRRFHTQTKTPTLRPAEPTNFPHTPSANNKNTPKKKKRQQKQPTALDAVSNNIDPSFASTDPTTPLRPNPSKPLLNATLTRDSRWTFRGPTDQGAAFDFRFPPLAPGGAVTFKTFWGAAPSDALAKARVAALRLEVWSLAYSNAAGCRSSGCAASAPPAVDGPAVFFYGFVGVGGANPVIDGALQVAAPANVTLTGARTRCDSAPCTFEWRWDCGAGAGAGSRSSESPSLVLTTGVAGGPPANVVVAAGALSPVQCAVSLSVRKRGGALVGTTSVDVAVSPPTTAVIDGPLAVVAPAPVLLDGSSSVCAGGPCEFDWRWACDNGQSSGGAASNGAAFNLTTSTTDGAAELSVNGTGGFVACNVTLTVSGADATTVQVFVLSSGPLVEGNLHATAPTTVQLNGSHPLCDVAAAGMCSFAWAWACDGGQSGAAQQRNGTLSLTVGNTAASRLNVYGAGGNVTCNVTLAVTRDGGGGGGGGVVGLGATGVQLVVSLPAPPNVTRVEAIQGQQAGNATRFQTVDDCQPGSGGCTYTWSVACDSGSAVANRSSGASNQLSLTVCPSPACDVNTWRQASAFNCTVSVRVADSYGTDAGVVEASLAVAPEAPRCSDVPMAPLRATSRGNRTVCRAMQSYQAGLVVRATGAPLYASVVKPRSASPVDGRGFAVVTTFTGALTNRGPVACKCATQNATLCACVPEAVVRDGGRSVMLMPGGILPVGRITGRVIRISYTLHAPETGLNQTCSADFCHSNAAGARCKPFESGEAPRDATVC